MSEGTIDELVLEVSSNAAGSVKEIRELSVALSELDTSVGKSATRISSVASSVTQLRSAVSGLSLGGLTKLNDLKVSKTVANNLTNIATALSALPSDASSRIAPLTTLSSLNSVKLSSTIPNNIKKISEAVATLPVDAATRLSGVTSALLPLKELNGLRLTTVINTLKKLPEVLKNYETLNVSALVKQLDELTPRLSRLAAVVNMLKTAYTGMPASLRTVAASARTVTSANRTLAASNTTLKQSFVNLAAKTASLTVAFNYIWNGLTKCINAVNDYIEDMNLFQASMGDATESALNYAQTVQDAMGIDMGEWARNQGVFQTLITGMGVTADKATTMSQQLTQLGYDISSFYNISVEDAMTKIQSGVAGELEPLRRLGWDLSNARMQLELTNMGIDESVQNMTQAEKVALRYYLIMNQVTITHGDMARTIASPANQLRVLQAQVTLAARSIGNLFIPMLNTVLPYVIGLAKAVRILAIEIANAFGIDATFEVDYSSLDTSGIATGVDDTADALEDAGDAASDANDKVNELKRSVMGFDELNKLTDTSDTSSSTDTGSSSASSAGTTDLSLPIDTYDFLDGLDDYITNLSDDIGSKLSDAFKKVLPWVAAIGAGIGAWKIADMIMNAGKLTLALNPVATLIGLVAGLTVLGATGLYDMWKNGQNWSNVMQVAVSALGLEGIAMGIKNVAKWIEEFVGPFKEGSLAAKVAEVFGKFGPALKTIGKIAGVLGTIISVVDAIISIGNIFQSISNGEPIAEESLLSLATSAIGIGMMFGPEGALVGAIVGGVIFAAGEIYNHWDEICNFFSGLPAWFDENVCQPVGEFFSGLGTSIATFFTGLWNAITQTASNTWNAIVGVWSVVSGWFDTNIIQPVQNAFSSFWNTITSLGRSAWNTITSVFGSMASWFGNVFSNAWAQVQRIFNAGGAIFQGITNGIYNSFRSVVNSLISGINTVVSIPFRGINSALDAIRNFNIAGAYPFSGLININVPQIPYMAEGGQVTSGQLFVARENGKPELVGQMGGKSTVANNEQIVEAIENGVLSAMLQAMSMGSSNDGKTMTIEIPLRIGSEEIARAVWKGNASLVRRGEISATFG